MRRFLTRFAPIILLLCHFALRTHNLDVQQPHLDEGFHLSRALTVWNFDVNPGRFAHGKMLLYFWLGLFEHGTEPGHCALHSKNIPCAWVSEDPTTQLPPPIYPAARMSIAIFSMLTAATIYLLGRWLFHPYVGLLALALYAILPFAFFYERLAFADPLAAGMMTLGIWRCMVFARHPTRTQAVIMGLILSLAVMAKMTMGLIVLLPLGAILIERYRLPEALKTKPILGVQDFLRRYVISLKAIGLVVLIALNRIVPKRYRRDYSGTEDTQPTILLVHALFRRYAIPLILSGIVALVIWLPVLIPAAIAHNTSDRFVLVNDTNIARDEDFLFKPLDYFTRIMPALLDYWTEGILYLCSAAFVFGLLWFPLKDHRWSRGFLYITIAMVLAVLPSALIARVQTTRYLMPSAIPIVLLLSAVVVGLLTLPGWGRRLWQSVGVVIIGGLIVWGGTHVREFATWILIDPHNYPFHAVNRTEFVVAFFLADEAVQNAAKIIDEQPDDVPLYATWNLCHMMYYYTDRTINCLEYDAPVAQLSVLVDQLPPNGYFDLTVTDYKPFWDNIDDAAYEEIATYKRRIIDRPVYVLRIWRDGESPDFPAK